MSAGHLRQFVTSMQSVRILAVRIVVPANLDLLEMEKLALLVSDICMYGLLFINPRERQRVPRGILFSSYNFKTAYKLGYPYLADWDLFGIFRGCLRNYHGIKCMTTNQPTHPATNQITKLTS